jgi:hypothetical protein
MIEFLLGASIITLIYQGVKLNKMSKTVEALKQNEEEVIRTVYRHEEDINRRIDSEVHRVNNLHLDAIQYTDIKSEEKKVKKSKK